LCSIKSVNNCSGASESGVLCRLGLFEPLTVLFRLVFAGTLLSSAEDKLLIKMIVSVEHEVWGVSATVLNSLCLAQHIHE
jgi:hypothetical protein